ncbi:MAG: class I SAM-dependent methyltransferase [Oceanicaulis sp.]|nr:class I SAM-dependent methyltransferase [Oceanicaulis sp.]
MRDNGEVFDHIYQRDLWRGRRHGSRSGHGSVGDWLAFSVGALAAREELAGKHVVDIGCGDFTFGARIAPHAGRYTGVDVSRTIIEANLEAYGAHDGIDFVHLDAAGGQLPAGDVFVIRQVLQHLPNDDIRAIMDAVMARNPSGVAVFEPAPLDPAEPNLDLPAPGPFTRSYVNSYVDLRAEPFSLPFTPVTTYPHPEAPKDRSRLVFYWWGPD